MKNPEIVVVGSLNMDVMVSMDRLPSAGETVLANEIRYLPGGKGANQAVGCAKLGASTAIIGAVGDDPYGGQLLQSLADAGVGSGAVQVLSGVPTGTAVIQHDASDNCIAVIRGANAACSPAWIQTHEDLIAGARLMLLQLEIPLETVLAAAKLAKAHGVIVVLNPAPAMPLSDELLRSVDYLTPNETEFALLSGRETGTEPLLETALREWARIYPLRVIVTRGSRGVSYLEDDQLRTIPAERVKFVDSTGAGDAFNAAMGVAVARGETALREALTFANTAAALSVETFGAQNAMPTAPLIARFRGGRHGE